MKENDISIQLVDSSLKALILGARIEYKLFKPVICEAGNVIWRYMANKDINPAIKVEKYLATGGKVIYNNKIYGK